MMKTMIEEGQAKVRLQRNKAPRRATRKWVTEKRSDLNRSKEVFCQQSPIAALTTNKLELMPNLI